MCKKYTVIAVLFLMLMFLPFQTGKTVFAETAFAQEITYPCPDADTVLQKGDRGDTVCWLQEALNRTIQAGLTVDGHFGAQTESALRTFQAQNHLTETGTADSDTVEALQNALASPDAPAPAEKQADEIKVSEEKLVLEANADSEHLFRSYWSAYFRCAFGTLKNLPVVGKMIAHAGKGTLMMFGIFLLEIVFLASFAFIKTEGGWFNGRYTDIPVGMDTEGCAGCVFSILRIFAVLLLLSPLFSDWTYLQKFYGLGTLDCLWRVLLFTLLRLLAGAALLAVCAAVIDLAVSAVLTAVCYPLSRLHKPADAEQKKTPAELFQKISRSAFVFVPALVIPGIFVLYMIYVPDIMSSIAV